MARVATRTARRGRVCLYRLDTDAQANDDERSVDDNNRIEMEGDANKPDENTKYVSAKFVMSRIDARNPAPFAENTPRPDTGFDGTRLEINLEFYERERIIGNSGTPPSTDADTNNMAKGIELLRNWFREDNSIRGRFRHGRIGIRNDYRPEFNLIPDNYGGYKLVHFEINHDLTVAYHVPATVILQYAGAPGLTEVAGDNTPRLGNDASRQTGRTR